MDLLTRQLLQLSTASVPRSGLRRSAGSEPGHLWRLGQTHVDAAAAAPHAALSAQSSKYITPVHVTGARRRPVLERLSVVDDTFPSEITTPHSLLFRRGGDPNASDHATPSSSWSSCSKFSLETADTQTTSLDAAEEAASDAPAEHLAACANASTPRPCSVSPVDKQHVSPPLRSGRRRSKSDVVFHSESWTAFPSTLTPPSSCIGTGGTISPAEATTPETDTVRAFFAVERSRAARASSSTTPTATARYPDFSDYVSGIGLPVDPDTEPSSVVQLQNFSVHSRTRSVDRSVPRTPLSGPLPSTSPRNGVFSEWKPSRLASPRPPLAHVHSTSAIPSLKALGSAVCNPGCQLKSNRLRPAAAPSTETCATTAKDPRLHEKAPSSPTLQPARRSAGDCVDVPEVPLLEGDAPSPLDAADKNGFHTVVSRQKRRQRARDTRLASRPPADEPVPISFDAFADSEHEVTSGTADEDRGRGRARGRSRHGPTMQADASGALPAPALGTGSKIGVAGAGARRGGSHRGQAQRKRTKDFSYAAAAERKDRRGARTDSLTGSGAQGRGATPTGVREPASAPVQLGAAPVRSEPGRTAADGPLPRSRLLSNSAHLLMLSMELAMIKNKKINAPLKARWGKRRDDDFRPIPSQQARMKLAFAQSHYAHLHGFPCEPHCTSKDLRLDQLGSRLKHAWTP
ncbi:hypothetical protein MSPP1_000436 [Malassezia sp. CBS 17886]|nr:hypothetical protein MSPP1_000436 [Malassezia sp. CBS 17886]